MMAAARTPGPSARTERMPYRMTRRTVLRGCVGLGLGGALTAVMAAPGHAGYPTYGRESSGSAVLALQQYLARKGFWCGVPDGTFGHLTQQAVWAVQKTSGLSPDGIVGQLTLRALARQPLPAAEGGPGPHVEVDLAAQVLLVVAASGVRQVLNTSTGNGEPYDWYGRELKAHTPTGDYAVYSTYSAGWQPGPLGDLYRPQYFRGGIAVHGAPDIPPFPASHGCCRVSVAAMDMLWSSGALQLGTRVLVH